VGCAEVQHHTNRDRRQPLLRGTFQRFLSIEHFSDHLKIPFVFGNTEQQITPLGNGTANLRLSNLVIRMWTSFAYDLDPNGHGGKS
jgi:hypothetical protein